jgi:hypothetical protein
MKKDDFMKVCRSKAKGELTTEQEGFFSAIGDAIETAFTEESVERNKKLADVLTKLGSVDEGQSLASVVRSLAEKLDNVEAQSKRGMTSQQKFNLLGKLNEKKDLIQRARKSNEAWEIEFHAKRTASALMTTSTLLTEATAFNNPNVYDDLEVVFIKYPKNFVLDAINSRQVSKVPANWKWKEQQASPGTGVPTVAPEGSTKPLIDYTFKWKYAARVKYAARIEITEEDEIDMEQLLLDIINMFEQDVIRVWQDAILTALIAYATSYTTSGLDGMITKPSVFSVVGALKLFAQASNYEPDVVLLNPSDAAQAIYSQDLQGRQEFIPESLMFAGLKPFISNKVTAGTVIVGTSATAQEQHGAFIIRKGVSGTQFIENESTIVGEVFSALKLPTASAMSWVKGDVATIKAALQTVTA